MGLSRRVFMYAGAVVFLLGFALYWPTVSFEFTRDDYQTIVASEAVQNDVALSYWFTEVTPPSDYHYRPLPNVSLALTHRLAGNDPSLYHLTNITIHAATSTVVFLVLAQLFVFRVAFLAAILFAVHPIHIEVVANIYNRTESMSACFGLLTIAFALYAQRVIGTNDQARTGMIALVCAFFACALLSKESAMCCLLLVPACWHFQRTARRFDKNDALLLVCMVLTVGGYLSVRAAVIGTFVPSQTKTEFATNFLAFLPWNERAANALVLLGMYLKVLLFPFPLSADYSYAALRPISEANLSDVGPNVALLLVAVVGFAWTVVKRRREAFWAIWFGGSFVVTSNLLIPIGTVFAERLAYLPSVAVCGIIASVLVGGDLRPLKCVAAASVVCIYAWFTFAQSAMWRSDDTLLKVGLAVAPDSVKLRFWKASRLVEQKRLSDALVVAESALAIYPDHGPTLVLLPDVYLAVGKIQEAEAVVLHALEKVPNDPIVLDQLGWIRVRQNRLTEAEQSFRKVLAQVPGAISPAVGVFAIRVLREDRTGAIELRKQFTADVRSDPRFGEFNALLEGSAPSRVSQGASSKMDAH